MAVKRRFLYLGVFLVAAGAVMLIGQGAAGDRDAVVRALRLWPVVVVAVGVGLLARGTRFGLSGGILAAALPGLLFGGLVVAGPTVALDCGEVHPASYSTRSGTFDGPAVVALTLACGDVSVSTIGGTAWQLETGDGSRAAVVDVSGTRLSASSVGPRASFDGLQGSAAWRLALPTGTALDLDAEVNAGTGRFDLAGARIGSLRLVVNAGEANVDLTGATVSRLSTSVNAAAVSLRLPAGGDFSGDLEVNAGSLTVCSTNDLGLRIHEDTTLGHVDYVGFVRNGDGWESPAYAFARHHADLTISASVGSVKINPTGGCK